MGLASVSCLMVMGNSLADVCRLMVAGISSYSLMAVPFFITMGVLMGSGGISDKLICFWRGDHGAGLRLLLANTVELDHGILLSQAERHTEAARHKAYFCGILSLFVENALFM